MCDLNLYFENVCWYYYRLLSYGTAAVKAEETIHPKERPCSDALTWVSDYAPCFGIHGNSVEILNTPDEFYQTLKVRMITLIQMILFWKQNQVLIINFNLHIVLPVVILCWIIWHILPLKCFRTNFYVPSNHECWYYMSYQCQIIKLLLHIQKSLHLCPDKFQKCQEEDCDCLPLSGDWPVGARPGKKQQHNRKL